MRLWSAERSTAQAIDDLQNAGLPAGPVYSPQQALDDPQVAAMGFLRGMADYPGLPRPAPVADFPVKLTRSPGGIRTRPPTLGEHTNEILGWLGYSAADVARLREQHVI